MDSTTFPTMDRDKARRVAKTLNRSLRLGSHQRTVQALTEGRYQMLADATPERMRYATAAADLAAVAATLASPGPATLDVVAAACRLLGMTADVIEVGDGPTVCAQYKATTPIVEVCCAVADGTWTLIEVNVGVHGELDDVGGIGEAIEGVEDVTNPLSVASAIDGAHELVTQEITERCGGCPTCDDDTAYETGSGDVVCLECGEVWDDTDAWQQAAGA